MSKVLVLAADSRALHNFRGPLLAEMVGRGHEVVAVAPDRVREAQVTELGARFVRLELDRTGMNPVRDLRSLRLAIALLRKERPDLLFCFGVKPVIYGALAARRAGIERVCALITGLGYAFADPRGSTRDRAVGGLVRALYRIALRNVDLVIVQNADDGAQMQRLGVAADDLLQVPGSGVDLEHFAVEPLPDGPPTFLLVARLLWDKGIGEYVRAARELRVRHPDARFQLLGPFDSNPRAIDRGQIDAWVRQGVIDYLGQTDDVRPSLARCSVFVLPSYREGLPRSTLEAMAVGRPVVTTDVPGCRETVEQAVNGVLVPARDPTTLAAAMERFIRRPELIAAFGKESRRLAEERYDVRDVNRTLLEAMRL